MKNFFLSYFLLIFGLIVAISGYIYSSKIMNSGDVFSAEASLIFVPIGLIMIFVWFLKFFRNPRNK